MVLVNLLNVYCAIEDESDFISEFFDDLTYALKVIMSNVSSFNKTKNYIFKILLNLISIV